MPKPEEKFDLRECLEKYYEKRSFAENHYCSGDSPLTIQETINQALSAINKHYIPRDKVNKAVEVLGKPVMTYKPG